MAEQKIIPKSMPRASCFVLCVRGQAALATVLIVGILTILGGLAVAFLAISFLNSSYGFQAAERALASASSGVNDAMLRLDRDKSFSNVGYCVPYAASCASGAATVVVTQNAPTSGEVTIDANAAAAFTQRKIEAIVSVNAQTGEVHMVSWRELTL